MRIEHLTVGWNKQILVHVLEVWVVLDLVQIMHVLEGVSILVHLLHVVILEGLSENMFRNVAKSILVLCLEVARVAFRVDVDLQVRSVRQV